MGLLVPQVVERGQQCRAFPSHYRHELMAEAQTVNGILPARAHQRHPFVIQLP